MRQMIPVGTGAEPLFFQDYLSWAYYAARIQRPLSGKVLPMDAISLEPRFWEGKRQRCQDFIRKDTVGTSRFMVGIVEKRKLSMERTSPKETLFLDWPCRVSILTASRFV